MNDRETPIPDELLSAYLDGELPAQEQAQFARALARDEQLRSLLEELRQLRMDLRSLPRRQLPAQFANQILQRLEPKPSSVVAGKRSTAGAARRRIITALLATAATLTVSLWAVLPRHQESAAPRKVARNAPRSRSDAFPAEPSTVPDASRAPAANVEQRLSPSLPEGEAAGPANGSAVELLADSPADDFHFFDALAADAPRLASSSDKASPSPPLAAMFALTLSTDQSNQFKASITSQQRQAATRDEALAIDQEEMQTVEIGEVGGANGQEYRRQATALGEDAAEYVVVDGTAAQIRLVLAAVPPTSQQILQITDGLTASALGIAPATANGAPTPAPQRWNESEYLAESLTRGRRVQQATTVPETSGQIAVAPTAESASSPRSMSAAESVSDAVVGRGVSAETPGMAGGGLGALSARSRAAQEPTVIELPSSAPRDLAEAKRADAAAPRYRVLFLLRPAK